MLACNEKNPEDIHENLDNDEDDDVRVIESDDKKVDADDDIEKAGSSQIPSARPTMNFSLIQATVNIVIIIPP